MLEAGLWGLVGGSSLVIGALAGLVLPISNRAVGLILAFGAGTLISAVSFELTAEAYEISSAEIVALGLAGGAFAFFFGNLVVARRGAGDRMSQEREEMPQDEIPSTALLLGAILDGVPESAVIGLTLLEGGEVGFAIVGAVFLSNLPEAISASKGMRSMGAGFAHIVGVWAMVAAICAASAAVGFVALDGASGDAIGLIQAFAAGAVLTMLADTMMPEAFEHGGSAAGLLTVLGFAVAFGLTMLG